jgi:hypothetical protein
MSWRLCFRFALAASFAALGLAAGPAPAQVINGLVTSFEPSGSPLEVTNPAGYIAQNTQDGGADTGQLLLQDNWSGGLTWPRVLTSTQIGVELTAAGLNVGQTVKSGTQAVLVSKDPHTTPAPPTGSPPLTETTGYFVRDIFTGLEAEKHVNVDFWVRPLTSGAGANPAGTPAGTGTSIGERQGNIFFGIMDNAEVRAAAMRFGVDTSGSDPYTNVLERHIDFASATAGSAVWVKSGQLWTADQWYNLRFEMDYNTKKYDFFVNGTKINGPGIPFYTTTSAAATRFFISRGTNQAGAIIDDISVTSGSDTAVDPGDFNADDVVDGLDFLAWQRDTNLSYDAWKAGFGVSVTAAAVGVPEPAAAVLALGALALAAGARRR